MDRSRCVTSPGLGFCGNLFYGPTVEVDDWFLICPGAGSEGLSGEMDR